MSTSNKIIKANNVKIIDLQGAGLRKTNTFPAKNGRAKNEAETTVEEALQIDDILRETEKKIKIAEEIAFNKGFCIGVEEGKNRKKQEILETVSSVEKMIQELRGLKKRILEDAEKDVLGFSILVAEKIIQQEISMDKNIIIEIIRESIQLLDDKESMKIRLHPQDYDHIREVKPDFLYQSNIKSLSLEKDVSIDRGGVSIETLAGGIDATISQKFDTLRDALSLK